MRTLLRCNFKCLKLWCSTQKTCFDKRQTNFTVNVHKLDWTNWLRTIKLSWVKIIISSFEVLLLAIQKVCCHQQLQSYLRLDWELRDLRSAVGVSVLVCKVHTHFTKNMWGNLSELYLWMFNCLNVYSCQMVNLCIYAAVILKFCKLSHYLPSKTSHHG